MAHITVNSPSDISGYGALVGTEGDPIELIFTRTSAGAQDQPGIATIRFDHIIGKATADFPDFQPITVRFEAGEYGSKSIILPAVNDFRYTEAERVTAFEITPESPDGLTIFNKNPERQGGYSFSVYLTEDDPVGSGQAMPLYRFYNTDTGTHFYTASEDERDQVQRNLPSFRYEGEGFPVFNDLTTDATLVYRLYNRDTGAHLYTAGLDEIAIIQRTLPSWTLEGGAFRAASAPGADLQNVHRFYNTETGTHFFTSSDDEMASVRANLPSYHYEGVAFYVPDGSPFG